ncbi:diguanylate cyclase [Clostridium sp. AM58-1XD]|uniref:diguanylate cyclase n=1 Tax=Clostridium sp. AM58-1XD TaxID=2292307 RepID=UPI0015F45BC4|nr:diguanylate cyclase [Clostridium sp. AM58-1XD]
MKKKNKILIADDSEINRSMLADMLSEEYEILEAANGLEVIAQLNRYHSEISLLLLDIIMPEMDGFEVLASMNKSGLIDSVPVIIISAETSAIYIDHAYDLGAVEYISRPFEEKMVKRRVKNTIILYSKQKMLENMVTEQILAKEKNNKLMVDILSNIVEFRNGESGLHVLHIRVMAETLLKQLAKMTDQYNLTPSRISLIANASALHDIGKISIPEEILNKPGKLTDEEYETMKTHSAIGAQMLENIPYYQNEELVLVAHEICRWHHERYDGGGYPDGLAGEQIPISAQVVALADVYDALTSERVYKPPYTHEKSIEMILNGECGAFSPLLLECLAEAAPFLKKEMKVRSAGGITKTEFQDITRSLIKSGSTSNRTLALLEQERTKYQFFASMSKEIQFEYVYHSDIITISEWGAAQLGISEIIARPLECGEFKNLFFREDLIDLLEHLRDASPDNPIVSGTYCLNVHGSQRWYKLVARPLWIGEETEELTGIIGKFIDIHEEQVELDRLKQMARHDPLTGLYNRAYARKAAELALKDGKNKKFAMLLFDLDFFKNANDQYGHLFGDRVLQDVAQRVKCGVRDSDIVARIGGDEFLIFMEYKSSIDVLVERIFQAISGQYQDFEISVSMGVALSPENGTDYRELFHHSDQALYAAKRDGKRHFCFYDDSMQSLLSVLSPVDQ